MLLPSTAMRHIYQYKGVALFCFALTTGFIYYALSYEHGSQMAKKDVQGDKDSAKTKKSSMEKINVDGEYLPYYGYTVVSHVADRENYEFIVDYIRNSKTISKYLSPLPASSYHVTVFDVFSQKTVPQKYIPKSGSVPSGDWNKVLDILKADVAAAQNICDRTAWDGGFLKSHFNVGKRAGQGISIYGNVTNPGTFLEMREQFLSIFKRTSRPNLKYHMTLGYFHNFFEEEDKKSFQEELDKLWKLLPDKFRLQKPNICYYESMVDFVPVKTLMAARS